MEPADGFALVGDETRVAILRELVEAGQETPGDSAVSFAELQERTATQSSSRFSYHLDKLKGRFIRETDDGYALTTAGWEITRLLLRGAYTPLSEGRGNASVGNEKNDSVVLEADCMMCDGTLGAAYDDGIFAIKCQSCGELVSQYLFPPGAMANRTPTEQAHAFDALVRRDVGLASEGVCPGCLGSMTGSLSQRNESVHARYECERCGNVITEAVQLRVERHPAVIAFCQDHNLDLRQRTHWESLAGVASEVSTIVEQPLQVQVRFTVENETLRVTIDSDLSITIDGRLPADQ